MKLLITGGAGFIGSNFIRYWLDKHRNDSIINLDALTYAGCIQSLEDVTLNYANRYSFIKGNISDYDFVLDLLKNEKPDAIINFAAESHNSRAIVSPSVFFETNVMGTQRLLEASRNAGAIRFHHISTCEVYGDLALDSLDSFTEESPYKPRTPYNASKAASDHAVRAYFDTYKIPITISNCANNYGPYQFPEKLIPYFTIKGLHNEKLPLYKQSKNKREWIHVIDHCKAVELILMKGKIGETYNVGTGKEVDVETMADKILTHLNLDSSLKKYVEDRPQHDRRYLLDSNKISSELNWIPEIDFDVGLNDTIDWYKHNESWWHPLMKKLTIDEGQWAK